MYTPNNYGSPKGVVYSPPVKSVVETIPVEVVITDPIPEPIVATQQISQSTQLAKNTVPETAPEKTKLPIMSKSEPITITINNPGFYIVETTLDFSNVYSIPESIAIKHSSSPLTSPTLIHFGDQLILLTIILIAYAHKSLKRDDYYQKIITEVTTIILDNSHQRSYILAHV
jgi:hypothetical protein